jgi:hemerythrin-like domain-containing protein
MPYSKAVQVLVDEHEVILSVLDAVEAVAAGRNGEVAFPRSFYEQAFDFFATFADRCHHAKEEGHLFPLLESRGIARQGGPIGCMLREHDEGRAHVAAVRSALPAAAAGDVPACEAVRREALAYTALLRDHIHKENQVLFLLGDQFMTGGDKEALWHKFQCAEHSTLPAGAHEKYLALAGELRAAAGLEPLALAV